MIIARQRPHGGDRTFLRLINGVAKSRFYSPRPFSMDDHERDLALFRRRFTEIDDDLIVPLSNGSSRYLLVLVLPS